MSLAITSQVSPNKCLLPGLIKAKNIAILGIEFTSIEKEKQGTIALQNFNSLVLENLSFRFAGRSQLLKKVNLTVKKGEITAIVGESGSGKSTLGQILQKFNDFEDGTIKIWNMTDDTILENIKAHTV